MEINSLSFGMELDVTYPIDGPPRVGLCAWHTKTIKNYLIDGCMYACMYVCIYAWLYVWVETVEFSLNKQVSMAVVNTAIPRP